MVVELLRHAPEAADVRMLTLTGTGGVGKTRLALAAASRLRDRYPDGVVLVDLTAVRDPTLVVPAIAQALNIPDSGARPLEDRLHEYLHGRDMLLLLDNFEQVIAAAPQVTHLLSACPRVAALVTSRAPLHVRAEHVLAVPPLALPDPAQQPSPATLADCASVVLFVQRVRALKPGWTLEEADASDVAAICARLDGLPLAIELAAARITLLPPHALLGRLEHSLRLLAGGISDLPERQQTMRRVIGGSYDLLHEAEQALFRRLAVFTGGCTLDAVETICRAGETHDSDVLNALESLVDKSLLRVEEPPRGARQDDAPRFTMLETIREFALEQLAESAEEYALRGRHAAYYLALAERAERGWSSPEQAAWLDRLEREHSNLRAALRFAHESGEAEMGLRLAGALWRFWYMHGHMAEGYTQVTRLLALDHGAAPTVRAKALNAAGVLAYGQGHLAAAAAYYEQSLALRRALGDRPGIAASLNNVGILARKQRDLARARALYEESLSIKHDGNDTAGIAVTLHNLAGIARDEGEYERATALLNESLALRRAVGDRWGIGLTLSVLGQVALKQGDWRTARRLLDESLAIKRELGDTAGITLSLRYLAEVAWSRGDLGRAAALYRESLALLRILGTKDDIDECLDGLAAVAAAQGQMERVPLLVGAAAHLRDDAGDDRSADERALMDDAAAAARRALGGDAFDALWAAGRTMRLERLFAIALDE